MPATIVIIIAALSFIALIKLKTPLGASFLICGVIVAIFGGMPVLEQLKTIGRGLIAYDTLRLVGIVYMITLMGILLSNSGALTRTVGNLKTLIPNEKISMVVPASLIGLLPMPGGAMLSAPMVEEGAKKFDLSNEYLTYLNFWFRHLWEYIWPLYPGIILSSALLDQPVGVLIGAMWPLTISAIISGWFFALRPLESVEQSQRSRTGKFKVFIDFIKVTWYIWVVIIFVLGFGVEILGVIAICVLLMLLTMKKKPREKVGFLKKAFGWRVLTMVAGVMIFKGLLENSGILERLTEELAVVPPEMLLFAVPFAVGILTGINSAYIGLGFPILVPFIMQNGFDPGAFAFAYGSGFLGVLISPVHLCLLLTKQYFHAEWKGIYKKLLPTAFCAFAVAILLLIFR